MQQQEIKMESCDIPMNVNNINNNINNDINNVQNNNECPKKRTRTKFDSTQLLTLEKEYSGAQYLNRLTRYQLAEKLELSERQVKIWYQNRRMKTKKEKKELLEQKNDKQENRMKLMKLQPGKVKKLSTQSRPKIKKHQEDYKQIIDRFQKSSLSSHTQRSYNSPDDCSLERGNQQPIMNYSINNDVYNHQKFDHYELIQQQQQQQYELQLQQQYELAQRQAQYAEIEKMHHLVDHGSVYYTPNFYHQDSCNSSTEFYDPVVDESDISSVMKIAENVLTNALSY